MHSITYFLDGFDLTIFLGLNLLLVVILSQLLVEAFTGHIDQRKLRLKLERGIGMRNVLLNDRTHFLWHLILLHAHVSLI